MRWRALEILVLATLVAVSSRAYGDEVQISSRLAREVRGCPEGGAVEVAGADRDGDGTVRGPEVVVVRVLCACRRGHDPRANGLWMGPPWACGTRLELRLATDAVLLHAVGEAAVAMMTLLAEDRPARIDEAPVKPQALEDGSCMLARIDRARTPSSYCLGCHDGTIAPSVTRPGEIRHDRSHPVGTDYTAIQATGFGALRPLADVDAAIVFVDGMIECTSCHDGEAALPHRTALPMRRSAMCLACHDR